jgi:hypothetical protein
VCDLKSAPYKCVSLVDEEEVSLDLVPSELHLLGLEIALMSLGEVGHKAIVIEVDGSVPEGFEGGSPTFNEGLDPEGKRLRYLSDNEVRGCIDVNGVGSFVSALAGEALCACVIPGVESDPLGWEIHPVAHGDVEARDLTLVFDVPLGHVRGFIVVIANELLKA